MSSTPTTPATPTDVRELTLKYAEVTNHALGRAVNLVRAQQTDKQAAQQHIPTAVNLLQELRLIDADEVKQASDKLASHGGISEVLVNVLQHFRKEAATKSASDLGEPESPDVLESRGSAHHKNANYCGYSRGAGEYSEADRALMNRLMPGRI